VHTSEGNKVLSKVVALVESFLMVYCMPPAHHKIGSIPDF
jgi:hypothetical protein